MNIVMINFLDDSQTKLELYNSCGRPHHSTPQTVKTSRAKSYRLVSFLSPLAYLLESLLLPSFTEQQLVPAKYQHMASGRYIRLLIEYKKVWISKDLTKCLNIVCVKLMHLFFSWQNGWLVFIPKVVKNTSEKLRKVCPRVIYCHWYYLIFICLNLLPAPTGIKITYAHDIIILCTPAIITIKPSSSHNN